MKRGEPGEFRHSHRSQNFFIGLSHINLRGLGLLEEYIAFTNV